MPAICRVGDTGTGICYLHPVPTPYTVTFTAGSPDCNANGQSIMRIGDVGIASCGHATTAFTGSPDCNANGSGIHRVGDAGGTASGPYTSTTGSPDCNAN